VRSDAKARFALYPAMTRRWNNCAGKCFGPAMAGSSAVRTTLAAILRAHQVGIKTVVFAPGARIVEEIAAARKAAGKTRGADAGLVAGPQRSDADGFPISTKPGSRWRGRCRSGECKRAANQNKGNHGAKKNFAGHVGPPVPREVQAAGQGLSSRPVAPARRPVKLSD
jgi:hypothetical protein